MFIVQTGLEVSANRPWSWQPAALKSFLLDPRWVAALAFELGLRALLQVFQAPLLPPLYFVAVPFLFYAGLWGCGQSVEAAHAAGWFFEPAGQASPLLAWTLLQPALVDWSLVLACLPTVLALTLFR